MTMEGVDRCDGAGLTVTAGSTGVGEDSSAGKRSSVAGCCDFGLMRSLDSTGSGATYGDGGACGNLIKPRD